MEKQLKGEYETNIQKLDMYVDDTNIEKIKKRVGGRKRTVIDPNKSDLIYCKQGEIYFRYTQAQRNFETKRKKRNKKIIKLKKQLKLQDVDKNLSDHDSKTINFDKLKEYYTEKNKVNKKMFSFYENEIHRENKFETYRYTYKAESNMIKLFSKKMGTPDKTYIVLGDWSEKHQMKGKESSISKKTRKIFRRNGYQVYMIDEYNTSKICSRCKKGRCENFRKKKIKDKNGKEREVLVWGLVICRNNKCQQIHNRDKNSTNNMEYISKEVFAGKKRPEIYKPKIGHVSST